MNYTKIVQNGRLVEVYQYEKLPLCFVTERETWGLSSYRREDNLRSMKKRFVRLCWRAYESNVTAPAILTLTFAENITKVDDAYFAFADAMRRFRREYSAFEYIAVVEYQKKGRVHFHLLVWGIPQTDIVVERLTRKIAHLWGYGFIDIVQTNGSKKVISYVSKYFVKSLHDPRLVNKKAYVRSREVSKISEIVSWHTGPYKINPVDNYDCIKFTAEYDTKYLGRGLYYLFEIKEE